MSERLALPEMNTSWAFEQATVQFKFEKNNALGVMAPKFFVQVIDQYGYQREWTIGLGHTYVPNVGTDPVWKSHMYRHPGRRNIAILEEGKARRLMERFHYLVENYPDLLFNAGKMQGEDGSTPRWRPRHEGFVHFAEQLLDGASPSCKML